MIAGIALTKSEKLISQINGYRTILGPVVSPDTTWMLTRSLETVWLRMERQAEKAQEVAAELAAHRRVKKVLFPGRYDGDAEKQSLWERRCTGTGSLVSIIVKPNTRKAAYDVLNALEVVHLAVSLGSTETLAQHPRSMTYSDMSIEDLDACGIVEGMIRISVGLESVRDIVNDLLSALDKIQDEDLEKIQEDRRE